MEALKTTQAVRAVVVAATALAVVTPLPGAAGAAPPPVHGGALAAACDEHVGAGGPDQGRLCKSVERLGSASAHLCRSLDDPVGQPDALAEACAAFNGLVISEAKLREYEASWTHRALDLQRDLDATLPLHDELWAHTHNSYNAANYAPTLSGLDDNQQYTIGQQLRMDVRFLEFDVHWFPSPEDAHPDDQGLAPVLCHGTPQHVGCSTDRHLADGLREVKEWLARADARDEVVAIYIENHLREPGRSELSLRAHDRVVQVVRDLLGDEVIEAAAVQPERNARGCRDFPLHASRLDLAEHGRVLLTSNVCGVGDEWRSLVFDHSDPAVWIESGAGQFEANPPCGRSPEVYARSWVRYWEDSTWLSHMAGGPQTPLDASRLSQMVSCGVNMPGFDQLRPDDGRLAHLVWSWAEGEPSRGGCATTRGLEARFAAADCDTRLPVACRAGGGWLVATNGAGGWKWKQAAEACAERGGEFSVPHSAPERVALAAATGGATVWLDYREVGDSWVPGA